MSSDALSIPPVRLGISACLLGHKVRYDGGHKRDAFLVEVFGRYVEWVAVCPEVEMGLDVPRDTLRLELQGDDVRLIMSETGVDYTEPMRAYAAKRLAALSSRRPLPAAAWSACGFTPASVHHARMGKGYSRRPCCNAFRTFPLTEKGVSTILDCGRTL